MQFYSTGCQKQVAKLYNLLSIRALKRGSNKSLLNRIICAVLSHIAWVCCVVYIFREFGRTKDRRENKGTIL